VVAGHISGSCVGLVTPTIPCQTLWYIVWAFSAFQMPSFAFSIPPQSRKV